jgi:hypothetical protein
MLGQLITTSGADVRGCDYVAIGAGGGSVASLGFVGTRAASRRRSSGSRHADQPPLRRGRTRVWEMSTVRMVDGVTAAIVVDQSIGQSINQ